MPASAVRRISPVHLAAIDSFFLMDDREKYPMTFASNLFFDGEFDRGDFEEALLETLSIHPLLHTVIRPAKQNKPCFVTATELEPYVDWSHLDDEVNLECRESIDLQHETGLRIWVRQGSGKAHIVIQFHHACCDGTGAHRFIGDLLAAYGKRRTPVGERQPKMATYTETLIRKRRLKLADSFAHGSVAANIKRGFGQIAHVFGRKISPLSVNGKHNNSALPANHRRTYPGLVSYKFSKNEHKELRQAASKLGVTLNDLILAETFSTLRDWNLQHGSSPNQRLRIMMPSDMRDKDDYAMSAANMTSYNFITRRMRDCVDERKLVKGIWEETGRIKREHRGTEFMDSIALARKFIPGLMPRLLAEHRCLSTVIVSHMGDPTRRFLATFPRRDGKLLCGDVVLQDMVGVSPLRPNTRAAISIVSLYRELAINLRCDPNTMTLGDANEFLTMLSRRLSDRLPAGAAVTLDEATVPA